MKIPEFDMHRPQNREGDWQLSSEDCWNTWQKIAAETDGIITPANIIDGLSVVAEAKVQRDLVLGHKMMIEAGRSDLDADTQRRQFLDGAQQKIDSLMADCALIFVDKIDGTVAQATGTTSRVGEYVDAGRDALVTAMKLRSRYQIGELDIATLAMIGGPKLLNVATSGIETLRGHESHTSLADKGNEALRALTLMSFDVTELIKTRYQLEAVSGGLSPSDALNPEVYERELYMQAVNIRDKLLNLGFATGALAGAVNLAKAIGRRS